MSNHPSFYCSNLSNNCTFGIILLCYECFCDTLAVNLSVIVMSGGTKELWQLLKSQFLMELNIFSYHCSKLGNDYNTFGYDKVSVIVIMGAVC